ncbi:unnamed protein product [Pedinophyceae sp. YPF-701]|nr:unnamed protein product [Pedinophyceae sp. YPF-701]
MKVVLEFSGGLELLFGGEKEICCDVEPQSEGAPVTVRSVMFHARDKLLQDRPELFMKGDTVRPGVLVVVNDCDWELTGKDETPVEDGDRISFISTLHGG